MVAHKVVDGSYLASVTSARAGLEVSTVVETTWEGDVLVGSSRERRGFDLGVDAEVSDALVTRAALLFGELAALPVTAAWSGLRPWLPDHLPGDRAQPRRSRGSGSRPGTRAPASGSARSRAGWSRSSTAGRSRWSTRRPSTRTASPRSHQPG